MNNKYLNNLEHVRLYKGGDIRISNSAQEAEQLRRRGWNDNLAEGVTLDEEKLAEAERVFMEGMEPELEGESITPENPSGAAVPPAQQVSGANTVMGTRDTMQPTRDAPQPNRDVTRRVQNPPKQ